MRSFAKEHIMKGMAAFAVLLLGVGSMFAQGPDDGTLQVGEYDGGSVAIRTATGFVNQDSSIKRKWYVIDDVNAPVRLEHAGVFPRLEEKENVQLLVPIGTVSPKQAISAVEVRYVLFDVWGERLRTMAVTRMSDSSTHVDLRTNEKFPALESEASQVVTVFAFVARVRTAEGQQWNFDGPRVTSRIASFGMSVAPADLNPDQPRIVDPALIYWAYGIRQKESPAKASKPAGPK
jgi:hypothetical protein